MNSSVEIMSYKQRSIQIQNEVRASLQNKFKYHAWSNHLHLKFAPYLYIPWWTWKFNYFGDVTKATKARLHWAKNEYEDHRWKVRFRASLSVSWP